MGNTSTIDMENTDCIAGIPSPPLPGQTECVVCTPGLSRMCVLSDDNGLHISDMPPELFTKNWLALGGVVVLAQQAFQDVKISLNTENKNHD